MHYYVYGNCTYNAYICVCVRVCNVLIFNVCACVCVCVLWVYVCPFVVYVVCKLRVSMFL